MLFLQMDGGLQRIAEGGPAANRGGRERVTPTAPPPRSTSEKVACPLLTPLTPHHQSRSCFFLYRLMPSAMPVPRVMSLLLISMLSTTARPTPSVSLLAVSVPSSKIRVMRLIVLPVGMGGNDCAGFEVSNRTRVHWA